MRFFRRLQYPTTLLIALLQRAPVVRFAGLAEEVLSWSPVSAVLKSAVVLAGLGAVDSMAGASVTIRTSGSNPLSLKVGTPLNPGVVFTISNSGDFPGSWSLLPGSTVPPGLTFGDNSGTPTLTGPGTFNTSGANYYGTAVLTGTPTTAGTYTLNMAAYEYPNGASNGTNNGNTSPTYSYTITVTGSAPAITFTTQPVPQTITANTTLVLSAAATGTPAPTYQWYLGGNPVSGANTARLVIPGATAANQGTYTVVATNSSGTATSNGAVVNVVTTSNPGRMTNLSVLGYSGTGAQALNIGFVSGGPNTSGQESLLIRGIGPTLKSFGVTGYLADTSLGVYAQGSTTATLANTHWASTVANQNAVAAAQTAAGTGLTLTDPTSLDSAVAASLNAGSYTAIVSGNNGTTGQTLAEVYDATPNYTVATPRLINVSARAQIGGAAASVMTAGFIVSGATSKAVLIRGIGPALTAFGVPGVLADPVVTLHQTVNGNDTVLASNAGWGGDPQITAADSAVYAFALTNSSSKDSALLVMAPPGSYTAQVTSASGGSGVALVEVYEVP